MVRVLSGFFFDSNFVGLRDTLGLFLSFLSEYVFKLLVSTDLDENLRDGDDSGDDSVD